MSGDLEYGSILEASLGPTMSSLPEDYGQRYAALMSMRRAFHAMIAGVLEPTLREHALAQPQSTIDQRRALAAGINHDLRALGLSLRCPRTNHPVTMVVDFQDADHPDISRFRLERRDQRGHRVRTFTSRELPDLKVMEDPLRVEGGSRALRSKGESGPSL